MGNPHTIITAALCASLALSGMVAAAQAIPAEDLARCERAAVLAQEATALRLYDRERMRAAVRRYAEMPPEKAGEVAQLMAYAAEAMRLPMPMDGALWPQVAAAFTDRAYLECLARK